MVRCLINQAQERIYHFTFNIFCLYFEDDVRLLPNIRPVVGVAEWPLGCDAANGAEPPP
jgi:hypothetical protein